MNFTMFGSRKRRAITWAAAGSVLALALAFPTAASASTGLPSDESVSAALNAELQAASAASGGTVTISDVTVDVSPELVSAAGSSDPDVIATYILSEAQSVAASGEAVAQLSAGSEARNLAPSSSAALRASKTQNYTADQLTALPSIGVAWVNQDMTVNFTGNTINSVTLNGNSYGTGISVFVYSHINTRLEYRLNRTCLFTHMKGTFSAIIKGAPLSFAAEVLASDGPRNGNMSDILYTSC